MESSSLELFCDPLFLRFFFLCVYVILVMEPRALVMLGKGPTVELLLQLPP